MICDLPWLTHAIPWGCFFSRPRQNLGDGADGGWSRKMKAIFMAIFVVIFTNGEFNGDVYSRIDMWWV